MDDLVKAAMLKWPHVPDCRGWLGLDARGDWYMRDDATQAAGPFPHSKGSRIQHDKLRAFIERNYQPDAQGCWYFQNGPQRVYVELEIAPLVLGLQHVAGQRVITTHTGAVVDVVDAVLLDEAGHLYLATSLGLGLVRSADMHAAADEVLSGRWQPQDVLSADLPAQYGYCLSPLKQTPTLARGA